MEFKRNFYQDVPYANAFFALQEEVFPGLDLAFALAECHLDQASIPYGLFDGGTVNSALWPSSVELGSMQAVSILNATPQTIFFGDKQYQAVQIGTVATHPDWRGQGLSGKLLKQALADYREQADFFFLFANNTVVNFYPRFGFSPLTEHCFERPLQPGTNSFRQLHLTNPQDRDFFRKHFEKTVPVSKQFGVTDYTVIRDFVLNKFMFDAVCWDEADELFVIATSEAGRLTIYDIVGNQFPIDYLLNLRWPDVDTLETRFTPDLFAGNFQANPCHDDDDNLFVLVNGDDPALLEMLNGRFRVPVLAKT